MQFPLIRSVVANGILIFALSVAVLTAANCDLAFAAVFAPREDPVVGELLRHGNIRAAIVMAKKSPNPDEAYALIAAHQIEMRDFAGARKTIRLITVGNARHPQPGLIPHSSALTTFARGLYRAGRKGEARDALQAAMSDAGKIPKIFAEMGEGFGSLAGERWLYIAETQLLWHDRRGASQSFDRAERFLAGSHLGYDASDALGRIEKGRRLLGDAAGAAKAHRELKLAAANSNTDIAVRAEALVDVDAKDGNAAGVLETVREQGFAEDPIELLCHGVRTINRIHGDQKCRARLLEEARKLAGHTKDPRVKKAQEEIIVKAEAGAVE